MTEARARAVAVSFAVTLFLGVVPPLLRSAPSDTSWLLYLAEWVTRGGEYGRDFVEVSPPLILWLSIPATVVANWMETSSWTIMVLWCAGLGGVSLLMNVRVLQEFSRDNGWHGRGLLLASAAALLLLPGQDFGQREHLTLLTTLPYVLLGGLRALGFPQSRALAVSIGLFAGLGFALKPYFLVPFLLLELYLWRHLGSRSLGRPEFRALAGLGALYLAAVFLITPGYVPLAAELRRWYALYLDTGLLDTLQLAGPVLLLTLLCWLAHAAVRRNDDPISTGLGLVASGFLVAALIQGKGFQYHFFPARAFGFLALARAWQVVPSRISWYPSGLLVRASLGLLAWMPLEAAVSAARELARGSRPTDPSYEALLPVVKTAGHDGVAVLSTNIGSSWPLIADAGASATLRYPSLWPLAAIYHTQLLTEPNRMVATNPDPDEGSLERGFVEQTVSDLVTGRPRLVLVLLPDSTVADWGGARRLDYLAYFSGNPRFRAFMEHYRDLGVAGTYRVFRRPE